MRYQYSDHGQPIAFSLDAKSIIPLTTTILDISIMHNDRKRQSIYRLIFLTSLLLVEAAPLVDVDPTVFALELVVSLATVLLGRFSKREW
jgi:hypothetical protein